MKSKTCPRDAEVSQKAEIARVEAETCPPDAEVFSNPGGLTGIYKIFSPDAEASRFPSLPFSFLLCLLLFSCSLPSLTGGCRRVLIQLPEIPAGLSYACSSFSLSWPDSSGGLRHLTGVLPGSRLTVEIPVKINTPLLAFPEGSGGLYPAGIGGLPPAGAVWPWGEDEEGCIKLTWEAGFSAALLLDLYRLNCSVERVGYPRLQTEVMEKSQGDPWRIKREPILEALWYGIMRADKIKKKEERLLELPAARGLWVSGNPLLLNRFVYVEEERGAFHLYDGFFSFYHETGKERIDIWADEKGWCAVNSSTGYGESGSW